MSEYGQVGLFSAVNQIGKKNKKFHNTHFMSGCDLTTQFLRRNE